MGILNYLLAAAAAATAAVELNETFTSTSTSTSTVTNCNTASLFHYDAASLNPPNPPPNTNTTLEVTFTNDYGVVENGTIAFDVNLNGLPYTYTELLCSQNLPCPIELGQHTVYSNPIDVGTTLGKLTITANYKNDADESLLCVQTVMKLTQAAAESNTDSKATAVVLYREYQ